MFQFIDLILQGVPLDWNGAGQRLFVEASGGSAIVLSVNDGEKSISMPINRSFEDSSAVIIVITSSCTVTRKC
jgi:hypothetical protein